MLRNGVSKTFRCFGTARVLKESKVLSSPVYDVKTICKNIHEYKHSIEARQLFNGSDLLKNIEMIDGKQELIRDYNKKIQEIQIRRKELETLIKKDLENKLKFQEEIKGLKVRAQQLSNDVKDSTSELRDICSSMPNLIHPSAPLTKPDIVQWINPLNEYKADEEKNHVSIMTKKKMLDLTTAANVAGTSWYYLTNEGAMLERALTNYAIDRAISHGFQFIIPPTVAKKEVIEACGFKPRDMNNEQQIYYLNDTNLGLIATAEITLAATGIDKTFNLDNGPHRVVGISRSYRAEAGARGRDTKGLYRVHEFSKVELFCWSKPSESNNLLQELKCFQIDLITSLGIPAKVMNMPANDLGSPAYQKYDIEAWMPGRGNFGEITSTSNCTDFQSRRMSTKYRDSHTKKLEYVHTLNGTAMAVPRVIIAIVENFFNPGTGKIAIPAPLQKYMGKEWI